MTGKTQSYGKWLDRHPSEVEKPVDFDLTSRKGWRFLEVVAETLRPILLS